jgi:CRISPR-associated protein Cas2
MYVVVVYDADDEERERIRGSLQTQLHWIQQSVFAGEVTKTTAEDLFSELQSLVDGARVTLWMLDRKPDTRHIGQQEDEESIFL